ncbi:MAG: hypothetical protein WA372_21620, partial [Candidatus Sulfotelmatobacter sp.]
QITSEQQMAYPMTACLRYMKITREMSGLLLQMGSTVFIGLASFLFRANKGSVARGTVRYSPHATVIRYGPLGTA